MNLLNLKAITAAVTAAVTTALKLPGSPRNVAVQANFAYGSGGTSVDAWLQTSLDGGTTWIDVANFHFTTAAARFVYNLNAQTPVTTEYVATDGTLAANTSKDGILGPQLRIKYTTVGTYAGLTSLSIDCATDQQAN